MDGWFWWEMGSGIHFVSHHGSLCCFHGVAKCLEWQGRTYGQGPAIHSFFMFPFLFTFHLMGPHDVKHLGSHDRGILIHFYSSYAAYSFSHMSSRHVQLCTRFDVRITYQHPCFHSVFLSFFAFIETSRTISWIHRSKPCTPFGAPTLTVGYQELIPRNQQIYEAKTLSMFHYRRRKRECFVKFS